MTRNIARSKAVYRLAVSLDECQPKIWRRLLVQSRASFHRLHEIIQVAMGWTNTHLYEHETMHRWIRGNFDPEAFDLDRINDRLIRGSRQHGWTV